MSKAAKVTHVRGYLFAAAVVAGAFAFAPMARPAETAPWHTGADLQRQLAEPVDIFWSNNPLRHAIGNLSKARRAAVLIDRRVDPGEELNESLEGVPFEAALRQIARRRGLDVSRLGDVLYLGPAAAARRLPAVAAEYNEAVRRLPAAARRKFTRREILSWEDCTEPRGLLEQLARRGGLAIERLELIPHDLWAAADLPPLSLADRLTLIAFQFDAALKISADGSRLELVPLPESTAETSEPANPAVPPEGPEKTRPDNPPADLEQVHIDRLVVRDKPLEAVLGQLARRLGVDLRIDRAAIAAAGIPLDQRVSVKIENATVDQLFRALLRGTRLTFRRSREVVEITPIAPQK